MNTMKVCWISSLVYDCSARDREVQMSLFSSKKRTVTSGRSDKRLQSLFLAVVSQMSISTEAEHLVIRVHIAKICWAGCKTI